MTDYNKLAKEVIDNLGGVDNITYLTHCVTRLRFTLKDTSLVKKEQIENIDGVIGFAVQGDQQQVIIGPQVESAFQAIQPLLKDHVVIDTEIVADDAPKKKKKIGGQIIEVLSAVIAPVIPAFAAAGMLKVVLLLLTTIGLCTGEEGAYVLMSWVSDVAFYFLPVLIAVSAGKRFGVDWGLAAVIGGALIYPEFVNMVSAGESVSFFGLNVPMYTYSSTIFPAMFGVLLLSYINKWLNKHITIDTLKPILVPMLSIAIAAPITFLVLAPLANWGANILSIAFSWMMTNIGPLAGLVIGMLMPVMTLTGLHQSLSPLELMEMSNFGYSQVLVIEFWHNIAEAGSALGTSFFTKDKKMKAIASQTGFTALVGVSEPALYAVMVKERASMLAAMIGNGLGGMFGVMFAVKGYAFVWPNIFSIPSFLGTNLVHDLVILLIGMVITFVSAFVLVPVLNKIMSKRSTFAK